MTEGAGGEFRVRFVDEPDLVSTRERTIVDLSAQPPLRALGRYRYQSAHAALPPQRHDCLAALVIPLRGDFDFYVDGRLSLVVPGEVLLISPGKTYRTGAGRQARGELLWLLVDCRPRTRIGLIDGALNDVVAALASQEVPRRWRAPTEAVAALVEASGHQLGQVDHADAMRAALIARGLLELAGARASREGPRDEPLHPGVRRALAWLDDHLCEPVPVARLVEVSGLSSTQFFDLFSRSLGTSPKAYVLNRKIELAQEVLVSEATTVTDLAHRLGFSSGPHFASAFRRYVGMSPSAYRRSLKPG